MGSGREDNSQGQNGSGGKNGGGSEAQVRQRR